MEGIEDLPSELEPSIKTGDGVDIVGLQDEMLNSVVTGVEMFHKTLDAGQAGDNLGLLLRGIDRDEVERGMVIAAPGSITPQTKCMGEVYVLKRDEGGRHRWMVATAGGDARLAQSVI